MRFIVREQPFEKLLAAGELRYTQDGQLTGAVEEWRATAVADSYQFLRVDLDARAAPSGHSYLYHALLGPNGRFERLKYRFWGNVDGSHLQVNGDVVFEDTAITAFRTVNENTYEQALTLPGPYRFWFPASMGLGYLGTVGGTAVGLSPVNGKQVSVIGDQPAALSLFVTEMSAARQDDGASCYRWDDQERTVWRDAAGWVVKMRRGDGLTAVAAQHIRYR